MSYADASDEKARLEAAAVQQKREVTRTARIRRRLAPDTWRREAVGQVVAQCCDAAMGTVARIDPERTGPLLWMRPAGWRQNPETAWWSQTRHARGALKLGKAVVAVPKFSRSDHPQALPVILCCPEHGHPHLLTGEGAPPGIGADWRERSGTFSKAL